MPFRNKNSGFILKIFFIYCIFYTHTSTGKELKPYTPLQKAPSFELVDINNKPRSLDSYLGKVTVINFWATWCPSCIYEIPSMQRLKTKLANEPFEIVAINAGEPRFEVKKFAKLINLKLTVLIDQSKNTFKSWNGKVLPTSFILDKKGNIRYSVLGSIEWDSENTINIIKKLITEEEK